MIRYLVLITALFVYSIQAFEINISCQNVKGKFANQFNLDYYIDDYDKMNSTLTIKCADKGVQSIKPDYAKIIKTEDGDSVEWFDLFDLSYEAIKNQSYTKEYTDTIKTDKNTFIREAEWSGNDTNTYKIHIKVYHP